MNYKHWNDHNREKKARARLAARLARPLVFITGCFDLFHEGHLHFLRECAKLGRVHVAINSDRAVHELKGKNRPQDTWTTRMCNVKATNLVEAVYYLDSLWPDWLVGRLQPAIIAKGENDFNKDPAGFYGAIGDDAPLHRVIVLIPKLSDISTTFLVKELDE
jgi:D-beta-D-heptose 7-phosphate kinase/D-beta-D-heptose 1-phosphate adenosyltransferase